MRRGKRESSSKNRLKRFLSKKANTQPEEVNLTDKTMMTLPNIAIRSTLVMIIIAISISKNPKAIHLCLRGLHMISRFKS